ncbi:excisionase [Salmonella enterica subsp. enterica]|uniref:Excisionase n=2 Tax=Salmonella enterica TaxID=28901 RepID=A0A764KRY1_SALER|nr:excisionase family protein [Salmonella enterica]EAA2712515.1 excisionase [Salmonella enterica subsp. enterica serovar Coeln]EAA9933599.1 excisionase [Salmonella enterica subsp. salamae]EAB6966368.1 excisionase [Salmonella enterica subsp. enterica serovar Kottbus]EAC0925532.1 excisionase [Salmonella enterica subsp. enterica serovar Lisboa]EBQ5838771.1 excisionase [Salmonella enterica subsp. enterica serovar Brandenburg]EBS4305285.1 excisionase [Salmonella enterica subsp. enterica serovar Du
MSTQNTQTIIYQIAPSEWVTKSLLIATTGIKDGTIERARRKSWLVGREYRHYSPEGTPHSGSECLYNIEAIMRWIKSQKQPGAQ